jgi:hypothetical protein
MNYLRRFSLRCRGSHGSSSLRALGPVSPHFLIFARCFINIDIRGRGTPESSASEILVDRDKFVPLMRVHRKRVCSFVDRSIRLPGCFDHPPDDSR